MLGRTWELRGETHSEHHDLVSKMSSVKQGAVSADGLEGALCCECYLFHIFIVLKFRHRNLQKRCRFDNLFSNLL
jgi:hypothetical protein